MPETTSIGTTDKTKAVRPAGPDARGWYWGTGRRKTAVARARVKPGTGQFKVQVSRQKTKTIEEYFSETRDREDVVSALKITNTFGKLDVVVRADGGGYMGQAQAIRGLGEAPGRPAYGSMLKGQPKAKAARRG